MKENEELIVLEPITTLIESVDIPTLLAEWKEIPELDPEAGVKSEEYQAVRSGHIAFVTARNKVEKVRKHLKEPSLAYGKEVDAKAREYKQMMADTEDLLFIQRHRVESFEADKKQKLLDDEKIRVDTISASITNLIGVPSACIGMNAAELELAYGSVDLPDEDIYQERTDEALHHFKETMHKLEGMIDQARKAEAADEIIKAEQERAAKLKKEEDAARAKEQAEFAAEKQKEQAKLAAEKQALAAEKAEWNRKKNAEEEERRKEIAEENAERLEREQAEAAEKRKREQEEESKRVEEEKKLEAKATEATIKKIEKKAIAELTDILISYASTPEDETAKIILEQIIVGNVSGVKWAYNE
jgi:hypothetical protein